MDPQSGSGSDKIVFSHLITPLNYEKIFSLPKYRVGSRSYRIQIQYAVFTDEQNIFEIFLKILAFPRAFFILNATAERLIGRKSESLIFLPFLSTSHVARKLWYSYMYEYLLRMPRLAHSLTRWTLAWKLSSLCAWSDRQLWTAVAPLPTPLSVYIPPPHSFPPCA